MATRAGAGAVLRGWVLGAMLAGGLGAGAVAARGVAVAVTPVRVELDTPAGAAAVQVESRATTTRLFQATVVHWDEGLGRAEARPVEWLQADPAIFELPAGGAQLVRLGCLSDCGRGAVGSYRLLLRELPAPGAEAVAGRVPVRLSLSLPVLVGPAPAAERLQWARDGGVLSVRNTGARAARLLSLELVDAHGTRHTLAPHAPGDLPEQGQWRWPLPAGAPAPWSVQARWDHVTQDATVR